MKIKILIISVMFLLVCGLSIVLDDLGNIGRKDLTVFFNLNRDDILDQLQKQEYIHATYLLRHTKATAERFYKPKEEYLKVVSSVRNNLPNNVDIKKLPFDLQVKSIEDISFGLLLDRWDLGRLDGSEREMELERWAREIKDASESKKLSGREVDYYDDHVILLDLAKSNDELSEADIEYMESIAGKMDSFFYNLREKN